MRGTFLKKIQSCKVPSAYCLIGRYIFLNTIENVCFDGSCLFNPDKIFRAVKKLARTSYLDTHCSEICLLNRRKKLQKKKFIWLLPFVQFSYNIFSLDPAPRPGLWYSIGTPESHMYKRAYCCPYAGFKENIKNHPCVGLLNLSKACS